MKKSLSVKRITALLIALTMLFLTSCGDSDLTTQEDTTMSEAESILAENYTDTTENVKKTETVYVNLNTDGSPRTVTVSDWLHADRSKVMVTDSTTLSDFTVTRGHAATTTADGSLVWHMASSDVYYEGTTDKELPVDISIKYFLNGNEIAAEELPGKSGDFRMEISLTNKVAYEVDVNGEKCLMYAPFVVAGGMMLDYTHFSQIEVTNGMTIGAGTYEIVALTGTPGVNKSLGIENVTVQGFEEFSFSDSFTVSAQVTDFEMNDAYFMIAPISALDLNVEMPETLGDVQQILNEVNNLGTLLEQMDPEGKLMTFMSDSAKVMEMMDIMKKGLKVYSENKKMLTVMNEHLTPENVDKLMNFMNSIDMAEMEKTMDLLSNISSLKSLMGSLATISEGLDEVMPIIDGLSTALEDPEVAASMERLPETMQTLNELTEFMNENEEILDILTGISTSPEFDRLTGALDTVISENGELIANVDVSNLSGDAEDIVYKAAAWLKLDYPIFTSAPDYMETSCTFICKIDPIKTNAFSSAKK